MSNKGFIIAVIGNEKVKKQALCCYLHNSVSNHQRWNILATTNLSVYNVNTVRQITQRLDKPCICLFMCDASNENSIQYAVQMAKIDNQFLTKDSVIILVGNKCDQKVHQQFTKSLYIIGNKKTGQWKFMHHFLISVTQKYGMEVLMEKILKQVQNLSMKGAQRHIEQQMKYSYKKPFQFDVASITLQKDKDKIISALKQQIVKLKQQLTSNKATIDRMNLQLFKKTQKMNYAAEQNTLLIEQIEKISKEQAKMKTLYYQARQNLALIEDERLKQAQKQNSNESIISEMEEFAIKQNQLKLELQKAKRQCSQLEKMCHDFTEMSLMEFIEKKSDAIIMYHDYRFEYYGVEDNSEIIEQEEQRKLVESSASQTQQEQEEIFQILA